MQVACSQCGATYEFESSAIPPEGYDAQCTSCGSVFFVAPEGQSVAAVAPTAPPEPEPAAAAAAPDEISVSCGNCGATYQFGAADIPAEGYDAQCTQCNSVFFVAGAGGAATAEPPAPAEAPVETPAAVAAPTLDPAPAAPDPAPEPDYGDYGDDDDDHSDLIALSAELGEPMETPDGASMEADFEMIMAKKRKRLLMIGGVVGVIAAYSAITYFAIPRLWDSTIGLLVGVKLTVDPQAVPFLEQGRTLLLDDTAEGYDQALEKFQQALAIDDKYPDAIALAALAHTFRGSDIQARGRAIQAEGNDIVAEIKTIQDAKKRPKGSEARLKELRSQAAKINDDSTKLFEEGGDHLKKANALLNPALKAHGDSAIVVLASGVYMSVDPDRAHNAEKRLEQGLRRQIGPDKPLDLANPVDIWAPYLQGRVRASRPGGETDAVAAFEACIKKDPNFQRARFELASILVTQGKADEARKYAKEIVAAVPSHARAKGLLNGESGEATTTEEGGDAPAKGKAKGKKRKKRRR